jgi:two-component system, LytTR family, sensor kinase
MGAKLEVSVNVDDAALAVPIPVLSIQPLVENAMKHGVSLSSEPGYVRIQVASMETGLRIVVENSGGEGRVLAGPGVGLENVRRRLEICYGSAAGLTLEVTVSGARAELAIPMGRAVGVR